MPAKAAVIVPAVKLPLASLETIVFIVLLEVADVAVFNTLPAVAMVAKLASVIPAVPDKFAFVNPVIVLFAAVIVLFVNTSVPSKVANSPEVGKVSVLGAVVLNVIADAFDPVVPVVVNAAPVNKLPPSVIVFEFAIPVPPFAGATTPVICPPEKLPPAIASNCAVVAKVPLVGNVTLVAPVVVKVRPFDPLVTKLPPNVIVFPVLSTPVPPFDPGNIPVTELAEILPIALVTNCVFAIVLSLELTKGVGTLGAPVKLGLFALTTSPDPVVATSSTIPFPTDTLPNIFPVVTF